MIILIDAYNLIKFVQGSQAVGQTVIDAWIADFCRYVRLKNNKIILVFDAGPFATQSIDRYGNVQVIFSGQKYSADQAIKNWLSENMGLDVLLVTSDRQIRDYASNLNVVSISSPEFYMQYRQSHSQESIKASGLLRGALIKTKQSAFDDAEQELDELMNWATRGMIEHPLKNDYDQEEVRISKSQSSCKKQRKLNEKLKKI